MSHGSPGEARCVVAAHRRWRVVLVGRACACTARRSRSTPDSFAVKGYDTRIDARRGAREPERLRVHGSTTSTAPPCGGSWNVGLGEYFEAQRRPRVLPAHGAERLQLDFEADDGYRDRPGLPPADRARHGDACACFRSGTRLGAALLRRSASGLYALAVRRVRGVYRLQRGRPVRHVRYVHRSLRGDREPTPVASFLGGVRSADRRPLRRSASSCSITRRPAWSASRTGSSRTRSTWAGSRRVSLFR